MERSNVPKTSYPIKINHLNEIPIFDQLSTGEIRIILKYMNCIEFHKGDLIAREGDLGKHMFFILSGKMNVIKERKNEEIIIDTLFKGKSIGEMSIIDEKPRSASLVAATDIILLRLTKDGFNSIIHNFPEMGIKILRKVSRIMSLNLRKVSGKLASFIHIAG